MNLSVSNFLKQIRLHCSQYYQSIILYFFSALTVIAGAELGGNFVKQGFDGGARFNYKEWFSNWDGQWYNLIVSQGYGYSDPSGYSSQVFFPLYPLLGKLVHWISGLNSEYSLAFISWLAAAILSCIWVQFCQSHPKKISAHVTIISLALILFWPSAYFLYADYTESLYMMLLAIFFTGIFQKWRIGWLVLVCGLITATRPAGFICCIVLALHVWQRLYNVNFSRRVLIASIAGLVSAWGLYAYMLYLLYAFGDPFLFITKQTAWNNGILSTHFFSHPDLLILYPAWGFLIDGSLGQLLSYSWNIPNRLMWLIAVIILVTGIRKKWLILEESVFCLLSLMLFYYVGSQREMTSVGRFVFSLLPLFLCMGRLITATPLALQIGVIGLISAILFLHTALFSEWHWMY